MREIHRSTDRPFCVNLVLAVDQEERIELLAEERVPVISFSWGIDESAIRRARAARATVLVQVGDVEAGARATSAGADVLIAQGVEAGGHVQAETPLRRLVGDLRATVPLPILGAGGIADDASVVAAIAAGATGVVAGTAYLATDEADVHPIYRDHLLGAQASATTLTTLFGVGWADAPHRVLRNSTFEAWRAVGSPPPGQRPGEDQPVATRARRTIVRYSDAQPTKDTSGDIGAMALYAGTGVDRVQRSEAAAAITARLLAAASAPKS